MRRFNPPKRQRGVAVIIALLLTTLAITIVASLFWQQQVQVRSIENQRLQLQMQWVLRGALDWAGLILREDAKYSSIDSLDEPWAVPLQDTRLDQYVDSSQGDANNAGAILSGGISDAQARYNLTNLCPRGIIKPAEVAAFAQLLSNARLNPALAQATANQMALAQQATVSTTPTLSTLSGPQPMNLTQVDDLLAVPGFTPEMLDRIRDFVIFLPVATPVNVNTAPAEVLAARINGLSLNAAIALVASRSTQSFQGITDVTQRLPANITLSPSDVSVMTNYFLVNSKVSMDRAELNVQALIARNGYYTNLVWVREQ
ncbi:MAG: General secretion pathway protein GspK [Candidatus Gallionella acididurans]|uniref:Type II secretion system protein K n=1 Tax=Candidatus Gallionella acididurans TaxID=1796491 RepID=A0A139BU91_9PROT|nr:MAG: General secretion pathway protein GspK [Candidatus Gallionella acididurans]